tara:strand:+ start:112 stop:513 length:402 start_codon:yes stop_codon:yes gene_type:complete
MISANQRKLTKELIPVEKPKKKKTQKELFEKGKDTEKKKQKKKPTTFKEKFNKKHNQPLNKSNSLKEISDLSGYTMKGIKGIFNKGIGAYKTNPQSVRPQVKSAEQWAYARVYASVTKGSKSAKIDKDLLIKK